jgi:quinol-cytochrome oxidoreductase complex cytochrome b subunit
LLLFRIVLVVGGVDSTTYLGSIKVFREENWIFGVCFFLELIEVFCKNE